MLFFGFGLFLRFFIQRENFAENEFISGTIGEIYELEKAGEEILGGRG